MRRTLPGAAIAALAIGSMLISADASAWCRMTTSQRQPTTPGECIQPDPTTDPPEQYLEWRRPCSSIALSVTERSRDLTTEELRGVFERSIATWVSVDCGGRTLGVDIELLEEEAACSEPGFVDGGGNVNAVMFVTDWAEREYDPDAFAVTTVWHRLSTGEILDSDMEINERRGPYGICPPAGCTDLRQVDLENVVTHELGHYLGLGHSALPEATMYASAAAGETIKRDLHPDDIEGICAAYPPGRPEGECDYAPIGGFDLDCQGGGGCCSITGRRSDSAAPWALGAAALALLLVRRRRAR